MTLYDGQDRSFQFRKEKKIELPKEARWPFPEPKPEPKEKNEIEKSTLRGWSELSTYFDDLQIYGGERK